MPILRAPPQPINAATSIRLARTCMGLFLSSHIWRPFPSRPGSAPATERATEGLGSHAQRTLQREHGGDGEQRAFPGVSTEAFWVTVGRLMVVANSGLERPPTAGGGVITRGRAASPPEVDAPRSLWAG